MPKALRAYVAYLGSLGGRAAVAMREGLGELNRGTRGYPLHPVTSVPLTPTTDVCSGFPAPRRLLAVPEDDQVRRLLAACPDIFEGRRNRALIALLADSGLRISGALRLRVEDVNFATRTIAVRGARAARTG